VTEADFDRVFATNVKSIFFSVGAFVPAVLAANRSGGSSSSSIINISSIGAMRPRGGLVWYNASKGAVSNATKGLAAEYGPHGIRVNAVCPLLGATGLFETFTGVADSPESRRLFLPNVPLGRLCEPRDVADACLFLASDDARFVTGVCLEVDGGRAIS
jgi:NAD(P)-dependent dehydrogenase (short-subunit alcohol dehydrogenase family)